MHAPRIGCDGPECVEDLVALIRGVGLCDGHLAELQEKAAGQAVDPFTLSRQVILQLLTRQLEAPPQQRLAAKPIRRPAPVPGFYWVSEQGAWTVIQVARGGSFTRLGATGVFALDEHAFTRMVPARPPR